MSHTWLRAALAAALLWILVQAPRTAAPGTAAPGTAAPASARAPASSTAAPLDVVISEVAWMGTAVSSADEWLELYNTTTAPVDVTGWTLATGDGSPTVALTGVIPAQGYFLLERTDDTTVPGVTRDQLFTGDFNNGGEVVTLRDGVGTVVDQVDCTAGWFAGHAQGYVPMVRVDAATAGSVPENWDFNPRCGTATNSLGASRVCTLTTTVTGEALQTAVFFNERATWAGETTTATTTLERALLAQIAGATSSIDAALYGLNRQRVIDALVAAHAAGVTVRVIGDDDAAAGDYAAGYAALQAAGIPLVTDTTGDLQHNKFLVIDGERVWTGSTNLTDTGLTLNANNGIVVTSTVLAEVYATEFAEMWSGVFHRNKTDNTAHLLDYQGILVESFFSPSDLAAFEVCEVLEAAQMSVDFAMFWWSDPVLTACTLEAMDAGVTVRGVWDQTSAFGAGSQYSALAAAGVEIRIEDFAGKVHHKFAVIDAAGANPVVILGSYNWTTPGAYENDENTLIVHESGLAAAYAEEWQRLWLALGETHELYLPVLMLER